MAMRRHRPAAAVVLVIAAEAGPEILAYCSETIPESFNPMFARSDSITNAAARTICHRLVRFRPGTIEAIPAQIWRAERSVGPECSDRMRL